MSARLFLGVDGGGTKTEFVCIDGDGNTLATVLTGTTYHLQVGVDGAVARLAEGVAGICAQLGITPGDVAFAFLGLPAFGEDSLVDPRLAAACGNILGHDRYRCGNDMVCGWAGSLGARDGINIVAGTGSIAYGERRGVAGRAGGWGELFSDEGSAYWIAVQGLNAFTRMSDGRLPRTLLHQRFVGRFALADDLDICARVLGPGGMTRDEIAGLARIVSSAAADGDAAAGAILTRAAGELVAIAVALRSRLLYPAGETCLLSWSGGVLQGDATTRSRFERLIGQDADFTIVEPVHSPSYGAALYAAKLAGRDLRV